MRYSPLSSSFFATNRSLLMERMPADAVAVFHANDRMPANADGVLPYCPNSNLFYLTGLDEPGVSLILLPGASDPLRREVLFVEEVSPLKMKWEGRGLSKVEATARSGVQTVLWKDDFDAFFHALMVGRVSVVFINIDEHARATHQVETANERFARFCRDRFPLHRYDRVAPLLAALRMKKRQEEIAVVSRACAITEEGFRRVLGFIRPGVMEYEIEAEYLHTFVRHGGEGFAYEPIIASGEDNCVLHYTRNDKPCRAGDLVLLDVGAAYGRYKADLTRVVPVVGRFTARQRGVYDVVLRVMRYAIKTLVPGILFSDYQREVTRCMEEGLVELGLIDSTLEAGKREAAVRQYFYHGVSHSLGIDVHDVGDLNQPLVEGSLWTVEPGIYIPDEGFGIRLENDVWLSSQGAIDLTANVPIEAEEIEALMAQAKG